MARVQLRNLEKVYGGAVKAVHGINLDIKDGEFMVFVGPSGCAKSTTLRMVAGLEEITGGEIVIGDQRVNDLPPGKRSIAMVFQNYALYPHMKVRGNLAFGLKIAGRPKPEIDRAIAEVARILEIEPLLDRLPKQLSGGQAQRVALGRALIKKPGVFLFDEPLSNLDAKLRASMRVRITDLHRRLKSEGLSSTVIYVTHDQTEAMTMGDRICVMQAGRIMQVATPKELYNHPANLFVAGFIGSPEMNLIEGHMDGAFGGPFHQAQFLQCSDVAMHVGVVALRSTGQRIDAAWPRLAQRIQQFDACRRQGGEQRPRRLEVQAIVGACTTFGIAKLRRGGLECGSAWCQVNDCLHDPLHRSTSCWKSVNSRASVVKA